MKYLFFAFLLSCTLAFGQHNPQAAGTISGRVMDENLQQSIPYATIAIKTKADEIITGSISDDEGRFQIEEVPFGSYLLVVQYMGYEPFSKEIELSAEMKFISLETIYLKTSVAELEGVVVQAERTSIEQLIDRKVVHVGRDLASSGSSAADIMDKIPSVRVDMDGNISLRGDDGVRVLVDGKPTNVDAATLLKQIPASSIEKIELITNPSAKYNPEGMSGIINIVLKKNSNLGFNGTFTGGIAVSKHFDSDASVNLNYRTGKFNFYSNLGVNTGKREKTGFIDEVGGVGEDLTIISQEEGQLFKVGFDYYLNEKNVFSVYTNQNFINTQLDLLTNVNFPQNPEQGYEQDFRAEQDGLSSTYNFNFKHDFEKEEHNIQFEMDYNQYTNDELSRVKFTGNPELQPYKDIDENKQSTLIANLDYVNPISEITKIEFGAEARFRKSENDYNSTNAQLPDMFYAYDENIYSLYGTFGQDFEKWAYQVGLRLESFTAEGMQDGAQIIQNDYFHVYPSAYLTYSPSEENSYQVSYTRRIDRPSFWQLNPTRNFSTVRLTSVGNPALKPELADAFEFNYTHEFEEATFRAGIFYNFIQNNNSQIIIEDPENPQHYIMTFGNTGDKTTFGGEVSVRFEPLDFWDVRGNFNLYSFTASGIIGTEHVQGRNTSYRLSVNNSFDVTKKLKLQAFGMYMSSVQTLQFEIGDRYFVNIGARYNITDKASVSLNFNDVFNSRVQDLATERPVKQVGRLKPESREVQLGFTYRFGSGEAKTRDRKEYDRESGGGGMF